MALADFNHIKDVLTALDTNKPSRFGYTEAAVTVTGAAEINALEGVYIPDDSAQINSIPDPDMVGVDPVIINIGLRSQAATIPRMAINHFFGRLSLNLLKLTSRIEQKFMIFSIRKSQILLLILRQKVMWIALLKIQKFSYKLIL